jgi:hypothetical protein
MLDLTIREGSFYQGGAPTYTTRSGFPDADERLAGLLLNHRVVHGIFDDLGEDRDRWAYPDTGVWDPDRNTDLFVEAMSFWREHGVIAFTIGLQGGNPFISSPPPEGESVESVDASAFAPDGSLRPAFMERLARILDRAKELDMVPIINYFYQGANRRVREDRLEAAIDNATTWLLEQGYSGLIIDLANECMAERYWPALRLPNIHRLLYHLKDTVDLHNNRTGQTQRVYVGASLLARCCTPEQAAQIPDSFFRASDVLMPHGNKLTTAQIRETIAALRERALAVSGQLMPIVYNEDIQETPEDLAQDNGGDLEHVDACLEGHASWGNLIRSHQRVPCTDWAGGTDVQRAWFARTRELAGAPKAPSSVLRFTHRI